MELGVFTPLYNSLSLEEAVKKLHAFGVTALEIGAGGFPGKAHLNPDELLGNAAKIQDIKDLLKKYNMNLAALSCHGNPVHPQKAIAADYHAQFEKTVLLAEQLGVSTIVCFSGCPGDSEGSKYPNWVTCPWPNDFTDILDYQWNTVLIPYWKKTATFAQSHGIKKIAFEMHPGFCIYNPETVLKMRAAVGDIIGANVDPSHLFWQGIDPVCAIKALKGAIHHFHAKDTKIDAQNCAANGVLDTKPYANIPERSWVFRTVGYGHSFDVWNDIISTLKTVGYDGIISIEHEDGLMSIDEGLSKAVDFLKKVLIYENPGEMWWV